MKTILTSELLNDAVKHYENVKHLNYVVNPSLPILFLEILDPISNKILKL